MIDMYNHKQIEKSAKTRRERILAARLKGTHTMEQWADLKREFAGRCVRCGTSEYNVERDHIIPLYQGGSDSIENIQPLCARCNCSKGPDDYNWKQHRRAHGFDSEPTPPHQEELCRNDS